MKILLFMLLLPTLVSGMSEDGVLYLSYLDYRIIEQVGQQVKQLTQDADVEIGGEIDRAYGGWRTAGLQAMRGRLERRLGDRARERFERFFAEIQTAESEKDRQRLAEMAAVFGLAGTLESYAALKQAVLAEHARSGIESASRFLSEVQTWQGIKESGREAPSLADWLAREEPAKAGADRDAGEPVNPLRAAEARTSVEWQPPEEDVVSPMDAFAERRRTDRERALADAQEGMRQVAQERAAYEQEAAAKELARAQVDAEAMRDQAQRLAATEQEALAQREHSWGNRLKRIVSGTVSAAGGAFFGGVGARAGQEAVNAVFAD